MTNSKMIKILASYEDRPLFEIVDLDKFDFEKDEFSRPVREVILLSDVLEEFKMQSGDFYEEFRFGTFKDLTKLIESGKTGPRRFKRYADSRQEFIDHWKEYHPDETYEKFVKRQQEKEHYRADFNWYSMLGVYHKYYNSINDAFMPVYAGNPKSTKYHK